MPERQYLGGSVETTTVGETSDVANSINIADPTGWPLGGVNGPFWVTINHRMSNEERVLVESRTGNTLNNVTRNQDNTPASTHANNSPIHHGPAAVDFQEFNDHINTDVDPHTQYMLANGTRHDLTARHQAGTTIPTAVPGATTPEAAAAEGVSTSLARADHTHLTTSGVPADTGLTSSEGVSTSIPRLDHVHAIGDDSINSIDNFSINVEPIVKQTSAPGTVTNRMWFDTSAGEQDLRRWSGTAWVPLRRIARYTGSEAVANATFDTIGPWTLENSFNTGFATANPTSITLIPGSYWVNVNSRTNSAGSGPGDFLIELTGTNGWAITRQWAPYTGLFATGASLTKFGQTTLGTTLTVTVFQSGGQAETVTTEITIERL